ncbi:uncharacterized protein LOC123528516 isoform X2 [Mercenaria mercenaria]|nr:uncharacterized protein LOC123528516 isoform X2 [Mercenaria mercenaria]XP_045164212.2 uncharacterized protein LOC123528516 isoform X2 [Mercenaria mercenaria]XP_045164213.2 uncharacterized protein LOC123528516 isoform X2 [Mercenaria mercenaria]XP_053377823.1 uncharacterized protein LOC123528516 isoform X2 [Mercenaria mercenaria]
MATSALQLTEDDTRRCRLYHLIVQGGGLVLRDNLQKKHPNLTKDSSVKLEIEKLRKRHIISDSQYEKLYPTSGISSSENYDITLLVLLHRTFLCVKPSNDPVWKATNTPATADISDEAEIVRLRNFRNEIHHTAHDGGFTKNKFDVLWEEISKVLLRFGAGIPNLKAELENLKTENFDKEFEKVLLAKLQKWDVQDKAMEEVVVKTILRHSPSEMALGKFILN